MSDAIRDALQALRDNNHATARRILEDALRTPLPGHGTEGLEDAHAALAAALLWLDGEYATRPREEFNKGVWVATARKGLAALVAAKQAVRRPAVDELPAEGAARLRDLPPGIAGHGTEGSDGLREAAQEYLDWLARKSKVKTEHVICWVKASALRAALAATPRDDRTVSATPPADEEGV